MSRRSTPQNDAPRRVRRPERETTSYGVYIRDTRTDAIQRIGFVTRERGAYWLMIESTEQGDDAEGFTIRVRMPPAMMGRVLVAEARKRSEDHTARQAARAREQAEREAEEAARRKADAQAEAQLAKGG